MKKAATDGTRAERLPLEIALPLRSQLDAVSSTCTGCELCQSECAFLQKYGKPNEIAAAYDPLSRQYQSLPFECSLCMLCTAVCPENVDPASLFLEMRREAARRGEAEYQEHGSARNYERRGMSRTFSYYGLPEGCDTVFFPGCALAGTRSREVIRAYGELKGRIPALGIVLDCCGKISYDLGRDSYFTTMLREMTNFLVEHGVNTVLTACPNCSRVFSAYGEDLTVRSIYEVMAGRSKTVDGKLQGTVVIHDPCAARFDQSVQVAVRDLVAKKGLAVEKTPHSGRTTRCCGQGGSIPFVAPDLSGRWGQLCGEEAKGRQVVTYCAGCVNALSEKAPTRHVLDILFEEESAPPRRKGTTHPMLAYWNRLRLKKWFRQNLPAAVSRERTFTHDDHRGRHPAQKLVLFLLFILAAVFGAKAGGVTRHLSTESLGVWRKRIFRNPCRIW